MTEALAALADLWRSAGCAPEALARIALTGQDPILPTRFRLGAAALASIGAIPAVMTVGWSLPSLFAAGHTEGLRRKLPFVLRYTISRAPEAAS